MTLDAAHIFFDAHEPAVAFAVADLDAALRARGYQVEHGSLEQFFRPPAAAPGLRIVLAQREQALQRGLPTTVSAAELNGLRAEGFALGLDGTGSAPAFWVIGADVAGQL